MDHSSFHDHIPDITVLSSSSSSTSGGVLHHTTLPPQLINVQSSTSDGSELVLNTVHHDIEGNGDVMDSGRHHVATVDTTRTSNDEISDFLAHSSFSTTLLQPTSEPVLTVSQQNLNNLFDKEMKSYENISDEHWKYPEYPLARIKKIMKMDEDVRMISGEVPILLSKAIEVFVTELTLRSWIHTEDTKRRTIQRSDIAMAIAKNDMFDFLIDIVPREEIQQPKNNKTVKESPSSSSSLSEPGGGGGARPGGGASVNPDLLQAYIQLLSQQTEEDGGTVVPHKEVGGGEEHNVANLAATSQLMQQQLQLLQQLAAQSQQQIQDDHQHIVPIPSSSSPLSSSVVPQLTTPSVSSHVPNMDSPVLSHPPPTSSSPADLLTLPSQQVETLHFQPHEHSSTDIVTLLSSNSMDQLHHDGQNHSTSQFLTPSSSRETVDALSLLNDDRHSVQHVVIQSGGERGTDNSSEQQQLLFQKDPLEQVVTNDHL